MSDEIYLLNIDLEIKFMSIQSSEYIYQSSNYNNKCSDLYN